MKIASTNNCSFKGIVIHENNADYINKFITPYREILEKAAKDKDIYISSENMVVQKGSDYSISSPVINVAIHPMEVEDEKGTMKLDRNYKTVYCAAFSYRPSIINEREKKFEKILENQLSIIG